MANVSIRSPWLVRPRPTPSARLRLFCVPYAGGSSSVFHAWPKGLPDWVDVCALQLPGRGGRIREPAIGDMDELVSAAAAGIRQHLDGPFAFFGHSMGSLVVFELARFIRREYAKSAHMLVVSGCAAPQTRSEPSRTPTYALPRDEFVEELRRLNGTPREVLDHPELIDLVLPILRADFRVCQTYAHRQDALLACPIIACRGRDDADVSEAQLAGWGAHTTGRFSMHEFAGGHFYVHEFQPQLLDVVSRELAMLEQAIG